MAMRYGKIYYYDRMGNKIENEVPYLKEDIDLTTLHKSNDSFIQNPFPNDMNEVKYDVNYDSFPLPNTATSDRDFIQQLPEELDKIILNERRNDFDDNGFGELDKGNFTIKKTSLLGDESVIFTPPENCNEMMSKLDKKLLYGEESLNLNERNNIPFSTEFDDKCLNVLDDGLCSECARHDLYVKKDDENKKLRRDLEKHIKSQNESLMSKKKEELLPMTVLPQFDREDNYSKERRKYNEKVKYRRELEDEIERKRMIAINELEDEKFENNKRNTIDAMMYAEEMKAKEKKDNEMKEYQDIIYQHQIKKKNIPMEELKEWWEKRPPFKGEGGKSITQLVDDGSHLRRQLEKQKLLQLAGENLEMYKANMAKEDELARQHQKEKYGEMRNDIAEQARLIREGDKKYFFKESISNDNGYDNQKWRQEVFDKWAKEHEKNDKKYKILQNYRKGDFGLFGSRKNDFDDGKKKKYHQLDIKRLEEDLKNNGIDEKIDKEEQTLHTIHRCRRCHRVLKNV